MDLNRRDLLRLGLGTSALMATGATVPTFLARSALAADAARADGRILVVVQLDGGNDGLNTLAPYRDETYQKLRPTLHIRAREARKINDDWGLHPSLERFGKFLDDGRLAIVQGVGYPNPNRSHFESMAIWQTARLSPDAVTPGWLARMLDSREPAGGDAPGLHIHDSLPLPQAFTGGNSVIPSIEKPEQLQRRIGPADPSRAARQREALDQLDRLTAAEPGSLLDFVERTRLITHASSARLEALRHDSTAAEGYPAYYGLAQRLRFIAQLIKAGLTTSLYYTHLEGFDTHANQARNHSDLLSQLDHSLKSFLDDLTHAGLAERVVVLVFSEFGRRVAENANGGTDHGTAAPVFLLGKPVQGGLAGQPTRLDQLHEGDPAHTIDFRQVYATLLDRWLGIPPEPILGGPFAYLPLLRG